MGQSFPPRSADQKVSVIVPCYNYARFLGRTIGSLQMQSYRNWEAIVVDDGSTDDTRQVALRLADEDPRVRYVHQQNSGTSEAKNTGIRLAQGEYVLFLDADDLISPEKLKAHVEHFRNSPHVDISYSRFRYFEDGREDRLFTKLDLSSTEEWLKVIDGRYEVAFPVFVRGNNMAIHAAVVRKALVDKVGFFDVGMRALEDWDYWLRCILRGAYVSYLDDPEAIALVRVHPGSATQNLDFSGYKKVVYAKVAAEAEEIRKGGDNGFYALIKKEMDLVARKERSRLYRKNKDEVQARIISAGFFNGDALSAVAGEIGRMNCLRAYLGALGRYFFMWR